MDRKAAVEIRCRRSPPGASSRQRLPTPFFSPPFASTRKPCPSIGQRQDSRRLTGVVFFAPAIRPIGKAEMHWSICAAITGIRSMPLPVVRGLIERRPATSFRGFLPT